MRRLMIVCLVGLMSFPAGAQERPAPEPATGLAGGAKAAEARRHMVVAAHPMAAAAGLAALEAGGTAADAAVAVQAMLTLVEPQSSGLGGGAFALVRDGATGAIEAWDGRETAPAAAGPGLFLGPDGVPLPFWEAAIGGRSVGVPGVPALLEGLHAARGRLPLAAVLAPAIEAAEGGFAVSPRLAESLRWGAARRDLARYPGAREVFFHADGTPLAAGETLRNPALAEALRRFAAEGAAPFYAGEIAGRIVGRVRGAAPAGLLTPSDLAAYRVKRRAPVCLAYRVYEVCGMGPPSSGGLTVGQILGMLEGFDLPGMGASAQGRAEAWGLFAEASKRAFADRAKFMADADFAPMPEGLLNRAYLAARAAGIDPEAPVARAEAGDPPWEEAALRAPDVQEDLPGTSHFVVVDGEGTMISMTSSIETGFGSGLMVDGFLLNNQLTDFSFRPEVDGAPVANRVEGGKRPRSSMAPTIVLRDGAPVLLIGSPGGSRIIAYVAANLVRILDWGMDPAAAFAAGHVANRNGPTELEAGTDAALLAPFLQAKGHEVRTAEMNSGLHAVWIGADGTLRGAADPRREGVALGELD